MSFLYKLLDRSINNFVPPLITPTDKHLLSIFVSFTTFLYYVYKKGHLNRFNWTYIGDPGKKHHIGLMHGAKSGHLLVYCDAKIILIDFKVLEDKTYTFFIDEQLCEISIELKDGQFYYGFEINKKADTPRNRLRKKIENRHFKQSLIFLAGTILLVSAFTYFMTNRKNRSSQDYHQAILNNNGQEGKAKITKVSPSEITYFYIVDGHSYSAETKSEDESIVVLENGMPLEEGDEFVITYVPNNPNLNKIDYSRPTENQINLYKKRATDQHLRLNPTVDPSHTACLIGIAHELNGIKGLADIYFQQILPSENPRNNKNTYGRLVRSIEFQNKVNQECWN